MTSDFDVFFLFCFFISLNSVKLHDLNDLKEIQNIIQVEDIGRGKITHFILYNTSYI